MTITVTSIDRRKRGRSIEEGTYEVISNVKLGNELLLAIGRDRGWTGQDHRVTDNMIGKPWGEQAAVGWIATVYWKCDSSD